MTHSFPTRRSSDREAGGVGIGFGTDDLRLFRALGTDCQGFLLAGRTHALKCTLQRRAIRQVRPLDPHINDFRAILTRDTIKAGLNIMHHRSALRAEQRRERTLPQFIRSEEHTSELQSLMRISYAVFCLKKKKYKKNQI